jgi:outer membrane protein OmpA-like peptidoglycan-associated protein
VINTYFRVLKKYRENAGLLTEEVKKETRLPKDAVVAMLKGIQWVNFNENCEKWFGISGPGRFADEGLVEAIEASAQILENAGDFSSTPIPDKDPYRLTNSRFLESLFARGLTGSFTAGTGVTGDAGAIDSLETRFASFNETQWNNLKEVGTLKVEPIVFQQGAVDLDLIAKKVVDQAVERLKHYPNFRIVIKGHTDIRGDGHQNAVLSKYRADAVARYLNVVYNIDPNRLRVVGLGGTEPLAQLPGETRRAWMYRLPRVELVLVREDF